ncbi:MAG: superoxide dismutase family protein [Pseudomonadota bacterium]
MIRKALIALALPLAACATGSLGSADAPEPEALPMAEEMPGPADGVFPSMLAVGGDVIGLEGDAIGTLTGQFGPHGLLIQVEIMAGGLTPGWHGLHLHQVGDCSDVGSFKLSGGHMGMIEGGHGLLNPKGPEIGDVPNIWAAADGSAGYEAFTNLVTPADLSDEDGTALIIHANRDDHLTQPIGGAGPRVACAIIN